MCVLHISIRCTFPDEGSLIRVCLKEHYKVDHVVLLHLVKMHFLGNPFRLLGRRGQTKEAAQLFYFPSTILETRVQGVT